MHHNNEKTRSRVSVLAGAWLAGCLLAGGVHPLAAAVDPAPQPAPMDPTNSLAAVGESRAQARSLASSDLSGITNLATKLLESADAGIRTDAAAAVLRAIVMEWEAARKREAEVLEWSGRIWKDPVVVVSEGHRAAWNRALERHLRAPGGAGDARAALAWYLTGSSPSNTAPLALAFRTSGTEAVAAMGLSGLTDVLMARLTWPEGKEVLETFEAGPVFYAGAVASSRRSPGAIQEFLMDPDRFMRAMTKTKPDEWRRVMTSLLGGHEPPAGLLAAPVALLDRLRRSTNGMWRAAGVHCLARRRSVAGLALFEEALQDPDPYVRVASVQGLRRRCKDRAVLEARLGPMVLDPNPLLAGAASGALLEPASRRFLGMSELPNIFLYEAVEVGSLHTSPPGPRLPLVALDRRPAFLEEAARRLPPGDTWAGVFRALLLAQYGRTEGLDHCLAAGGWGRPNDPYTRVLLGCVALVRDPKYAPFVLGVLDRSGEEWEFQKVMIAVRNMPGPQARQLRMEINNRLWGRR